MVRTRFAPSPTGYLHIGGARTALFSWAYARHHGGSFVLRIEDTDRERSTAASTQAILEGMAWLGLDYDEGPFYQMQRLPRYREVVDHLLRTGWAYPCYASREELEVLRESQRARGEKPRYDGRWRDSKATPPTGIAPVIRFKTPLEGSTTFHDLIKGPITVANSELDDLVLLRSDGIPTYNFGVVVDDLDMQITHIIRGDDHVNNTPRQIHLIQALGASLPQFAHLPMILGQDGERLSKRHGAVSVLQYQEEGFLPEALLNYLARLGWSHGDAEIFSQEDLVSWFDLAHVNRSPARFNPEKLLWLNQHYLKESSDTRLVTQLRSDLALSDAEWAMGPAPEQVVALLKGRLSHTTELADAARYFYTDPLPTPDILAQPPEGAVRDALHECLEAFQTVAWTPESLGPLIKQTAQAHGLKMGPLGMPLRTILCGTPHTPSLDVTLHLIGREAVTRRLRQFLSPMD
ncbi:glutamate--tRNA ligase [Ferrovum sp.]|uniref:glutamate--tRNA ligase n=1 Tax=Ferrovum sp. TaxID=2609467 RepID=UPI002608D322|nr:glutamate--tRNA ligase [Ferrovum sp.]